jgi:hypothetical protein
MGKRRMIVAAYRAKRKEIGNMNRIIYSLFCYLLLLCFCVPAHAGGRVVGSNNLCMDLKGGGGKGTSVIQWPCKGNQANQRWSFDLPQILSDANDMCLDVKGGLGKGRDVIVWPCNGRKNQKWYPKNDGTIRAGNGMCLDARKGGGKGVGLTIWPCNGQRNQKWRW